MMHHWLALPPEFKFAQIEDTGKLGVSAQPSQL